MAGLRLHRGWPAGSDMAPVLGSFEIERGRCVQPSPLRLMSQIWPARFDRPDFTCHFAGRVAQKKWQLGPVTGPGGPRGLRGPASEIRVCHLLPSKDTWETHLLPEIV